MKLTISNYIVFISLSCSASQPALKNHLDFMLIIENGSNEFETLKRGAIPSVFSSLMTGDAQRVPMVVHSGVMGMLSAASKDTTSN
ncbi:MAG TPA: hypothetical protein VIJ14_06575, partial [Rhabdochlamydiaceae bacterium]